MFRDMKDNFSGISYNREVLDAGVFKLLEISKREYESGKKDKEKEKHSEQFKLIPYCTEYPLPSKIYGRSEKLAAHVYSFFKTKKRTMMASFVGNAGSGKTMIAELVCNMAIRDGYPVIAIDGSSISESRDSKLALFTYLDNVRDCVLFIDEFCKMIGYFDQNKLLTTLTSKDRNVLWIITENTVSSFNKFILERPGRMRYLIEFNKIEKDVVEEYCKDHTVSETFYTELLLRHALSPSFSFDQLEALVEEHQFSPEKSIDELCELLNIKHIVLTYKLTIKKVVFLGVEIPQDLINLKLGEIDESSKRYDIPIVQHHNALLTLTVNQIMKVKNDLNYLKIKSLSFNNPMANPRIEDVDKQLTEAGKMSYTSFIKELPNEIKRKEFEKLEGRRIEEVNGIENFVLFNENVEIFLTIENKDGEEVNV